MPVSPLYPVGADLVNLLTACGFAGTGANDFAALEPGTKVQAAIEAWEEETEWFPFLSPGVVQTRLFDPPGPPARRDGFLSLRGGGSRLSLGAGLLALSGVTVSGADYDPAFQFLLRPDNAPLRGKPYTAIEFLSPVFARAGYVAVTGVWGYTLACPAKAREAILAQAAALCVPALALLISRGLIERKAGDESERYASSGVTPLSAERAMWEATFAQAVYDLGRHEIF